MTTKLALQKILKRILHIEEEDKHNQETTGKTKSHCLSRLANEGKERSIHHKNNKMTRNTAYLYIMLTLNVNSLNSPIKRPRMVG
jgi:hypothetical protein